MLSLSRGRPLVSAFATTTTIATRSLAMDAASETRTSYSYSVTLARPFDEVLQKTREALKSSTKAAGVFCHRF